MTLLVTGADGQLGRALAALGPRAGVTTLAFGRAALDVTDADAVGGVFDAVETEPGEPLVVVNAAAYTNVDRAESEPERAMAVNRDGAAHVAEACAARGIPLLHVSTDYVFDGTKGAPYVEADPTAPLGAYGRSKWAGEEAVRERAERHVVVRTAWVFSATGHNFVRTMLRLAREREHLRVVADQHGGPTAADDLAVALVAVAQQVAANPEGERRWGTYHLAGVPPTTWHGLAEATLDEARRHGRIAARTVEPIATAEFPTAAPRPAHSVLDSGRITAAFGVGAPDWRPALARVVAELMR